MECIMLVKVDWISFTLKLDNPSTLRTDELVGRVGDALRDLHQHLPVALGLHEVYPTAGRAPYSICWKTTDNGVSLFASPRLDHCLIEISGKGCEKLYENDLMFPILYVTAPRLTRLDLACDTQTSTRPLEFAEKRDKGRFKAHSHMVSATGETYYVGSRTSDRYARIYRYNFPHERSHLLRVEYVVKGVNAQNAAFAICATGENPLARNFGEAFGFSHPDWNVDADTIDFRMYRKERHEGKTLFWLADTVAPLLARLHKEGTIDVEQWVADNVKPLIEGKR